MFPVDKIDTTDERAALDHFDDDKVKARGGKEKSTVTEDVDSTTEETSDETTEETEDIGEEIEDSTTEETTEEEDETEEIEEDNLYQQIKARDPKLLKDIPDLKHILFRDREITQLFPTVDDAREAAEGYQVFQQFQDDIASGDSSKLVAALAETNKESLEAFAGGFLTTLEKQSKDLYLETLYPEFKKLFRAAARSNDENLKNSAMHLHNFVFGDVELSAEVGLKSKKADPKEDELTKREQAFEQRQYTSFAKDISTVAVGRAKRIINKAFDNSDLSDLIKESLTDKIYDRVDKAVTKDIRHMGNMNNLWKQAKAAGFTSEWKDRITNAYLSRAKLLIPKVRQQVLSEAKVAVKVNDETRIVRRVPSSSGVSQQGNIKPGQKLDVRKLDLSGENAERDLLDGKVVYKK